MKHALPLISRMLELAEINPALLVIVASLSVPLALIYAALSFVNAPPLNLLAFLVLSVLALSYCGWLARLVLRHWDGAAGPRRENQNFQLTPTEKSSDSGSLLKEPPPIRL